MSRRGNEGTEGRIPQDMDEREFVWCTREECAALLQARKEALSAATAQNLSGEPLPIPWRRGWTAYLRIVERDRDGSLKARIRVLDPTGTLAYQRNVRLVRTEPRRTQRTVALRRR
jgi:hypothetical protein